MKTIADIDHVLPLIGELGRYQIIVLVILSLAVMQPSLQWLGIYFLYDNHPWRCVTDSTKCNVSGVINADSPLWLLKCCKIRNWKHSHSGIFSFTFNKIIHIQEFFNSDSTKSFTFKNNHSTSNYIHRVT